MSEKALLGANQTCCQRCANLQVLQVNALLSDQTKLSKTCQIANFRNPNTTSRG